MHTWVCWSICTCVCTCGCARAYAYICVCTYECAGTYAYICVCVHTWVCWSICTCVSTHGCARAYAYMCRGQRSLLNVLISPSSSCAWSLQSHTRAWCPLGLESEAAVSPWQEQQTPLATERPLQPLLASFIKEISGSRSWTKLYPCIANI